MTTNLRTEIFLNARNQQSLSTPVAKGLKISFRNSIQAILSLGCTVVGISIVFMLFLQVNSLNQELNFFNFQNLLGRKKQYLIFPASLTEINRDEDTFIIKKSRRKHRAELF